MVEDVSNQGAFIYFYHFSACSVLQAYQLQGVNQGIKEISQDLNKSTLAVLGYNNQNGNLYEVIAVFIFTIDKITGTLIPQFKTLYNNQVAQDHISILTSTFVLDQQNKQSTIFVVAKTSFRKYFLASQSEPTQPQPASVPQFQSLSRTSPISITSYQTNDGNVVINSLDSQKTIFEFYNPLDSQFSKAVQSNPLIYSATPIYSIQFDQNHGGTGQAKMAVTGSLSAGLTLSQCLYSHGGIPNTTIINFVTITANSKVKKSVRYFTIPQSLKCLLVEFPNISQEPLFILVDSSNRFIKFNMSNELNGSIKLQSMSNSVSYFNQKDSNTQLKAVILFAASTQFWDHVIFGITPQITIQDQTFKFSNPLGYVMAMQVNRVNPFFVNSSGQDLLTITASDFLSYSEIFTYIYEGSQTNVNLSALVPKFSFFNLLLDKGSWIINLPACQSFSQTLTSECKYYAFFNSFKNFTAIDRPNVPQGANFCNPKEVFSFSSYSALTDAERNIRSTCYPYFSEQTNQYSTSSFKNLMGIPIDSFNQPMLQVDLDYFTIRWNQTINAEIMGSCWSYSGIEKSDMFFLSPDKTKTGYIGSASFNTLAVQNSQVNLISNKDWTLQILSSLDIVNTVVTVSCWSIVCPNFVHFNPQNASFWTTTAETNFDKVNGTYIYYVEMKSDLKIQRLTYTFVMVQPRVSSPGININLPFNLWYQANQYNLPYYVSPPMNNTTFQIEEDQQVPSDLVNVIQNSLGKQTTNFIANWTQDDLIKAYQEALIRVNAPIIPIGVHPQISSMGILTISFTQPVSFPSYLQKDFIYAQNFPKKNKKSNGSRRMQRKLGVFWVKNTFQDANQTSLPFILYQPSTNSIDPSFSQPNILQSMSNSFVSSSQQIISQQTQSQQNPNSQQFPTQSVSNSTSQQSGSTQNQGPPGPQNQGLPGPQNIGPPGPQNQGLPGPQNIGPQGIPQNFQPGIQQNQESPGDPLNQEIPRDPQKQELTQQKIDPTQCSSMQYYNKQTKSCENLEIYFGTLNELFTVRISSSIDEQSSVNQVQMTQKIVNMTSTEIKIQFNFTQSLEISPSNIVSIFMNFGLFEKGLQKNLTLTLPCTRQVIQGTTTNTVIALSKASQAAAVVAGGGSLAFKLAMQGCLAQVWGMINGMQIITYLPAINVSFPSNAFLIINQIVQVATFDFPYINLYELKKIKKSFPLPTNTTVPFGNDTASANIQSQLNLLGFFSIYQSDNLGSFFIISMCAFFCYIITFLLEMMRKIPFFYKLNRMLKRKLYWNFGIRLIIEGALELSFSAFINLKYGVCSFKILGSWVNYFYSIFLTATLILMPVVVLLFYCLNFKKLEEKDFEEKFGTVYEGLNASKRSSLFFTVIFLLRRITFSLVSLLLYDYVIIQIILVIVTNLIQCVYLLHFWPFEEQLMNRLEAMTELTTLALTDLCFIFTPIVSQVRTQYITGFFFIVIMCSCIFIHIFFLLKDLFIQFKIKLKRKRARNKILLLLRKTKPAKTFRKKIDNFFAKILIKIKSLCTFEDLEQEEDSIEEELKIYFENKVLQGQSKQLKIQQSFDQNQSEQEKDSSEEQKIEKEPDQMPKKFSELEPVIEEDQGFNSFQTITAYQKEHSKLQNYTANVINYTENIVGHQQNLLNPQKNVQELLCGQDQSALISSTRDRLRNELRVDTSLQIQYSGNKGGQGQFQQQFDNSELATRREMDDKLSQRKQLLASQLEVQVVNMQQQILNDMGSYIESESSN